jgi:RNA polymerase sigma-70 factor (ECF subfamily)
MTSSTSISLLKRVRQPEDRQAWDRFVALYTPLLYSWACRLRLPEADAADLVQDVFVILLKKLPDFEYDPNKSFRAWLWTVARNKYLERLRRPPERSLGDNEDSPAQLAVDDGAELFAEAEYRTFLVGRALRLMQSEFQATTWKACWECVVNSKSAAAVAAELGTTVEVVWAAKARVLRRLREELQGLLE